ncbi:cytochrome c1 [Paracoccus benzoatiresistens]|uniref:cytochrome c1 n=1 Tax=Paracoccus benzoatiresistens TaxID=2997341 RepID=UPI002E30D5CD|nr:cytochrome c1 [Paracoccus sp. EF6]
MILRTKTLSAALALAISAGGTALAQDAATPVPAPQGGQTQQSSEPTATPAPAGQTDAGQAGAAPAEAPGAPAEAGSGVTPSGERATAPTQSSEPVTTQDPAEETPMEAPTVPSAAQTDTVEEPGAGTGDAAPAEGTTEAAPAAEEAPAAEGAAPAEAPAAEAPAEEAPAEEAPAAEAEAAGEEAGGPAANAAQMTEGQEAAVPAETTGQVVAEEGHDDIEGHAAEGEQPAADHGAAHIEDIAFSFEGPFGKFDQFQLQRGLQVYTEVCAACHGMKFVPIRTLHDNGGPGLPEDQVRAYAANLTPVLDPDTGEERPRLPTDHFPTVTGDGMGPDLSLMAKARAGFHGPYGTGISQLVNGIGGPEYIHAVLTGYTGEQVEQAGTVLYQNTAFPSGNIAMPPPLSDDLVTYEDGTPATVDQMARDVSAFLMWTAEPKLTYRKQVGLVSVLFLIVLTSLLYLTNKRLWAPHKRKLHHKH